MRYYKGHLVTSDNVRYRLWACNATLLTSTTMTQRFSAHQNICPVWTAGWTALWNNLTIRTFPGPLKRIVGPGPCIIIHCVLAILSLNTNASSGYVTWQCAGKPRGQSIAALRVSDRLAPSDQICRDSLCAKVLNCFNVIEFIKRTVLCAYSQFATVCMQDIHESTTPDLQVNYIDTL